MPVLSDRLGKRAGPRLAQRLARRDQEAIGDDIRFVQWAWPIGKPLVDGLGAGLHEVRSFHDGCAYRVLFGVERGAMILLHGFQKKTARTPRPDLELARGRLRGSR